MGRDLDTALALATPVDRRIGAAASPVPTGGVTDAAVRADERRRISAILDAPEAAGRPVETRRLAFSTDMTVTEARAVLGAASAAEGDRWGNAFAKAGAGRVAQGAGTLDAATIYGARREAVAAAGAGQADAGDDSPSVYARRRSRGEG